MRYLITVFLILVTVFGSSCKYFKGSRLFGRKEKTLEALRAQQDSVRVADSLRKVKEHIQALELARQDSARLAEEARKAEENDSRYNIIIGSFITPEYAAKYAESFRQQGFDTRIIKPGGSRFELVAAEAHKYLREAVPRLQQFQDTVVMDAWLFVRK